jgi:heme a synthase
MSVVASFSTGANPAATGARAVRSWLLLLALMVFAMVIVGGATRMTGSGLSITQWRPVTGALPPLSDAAWQDAFALYKQIPQYELLNKGMSLVDFKTIYWWEWSHRQLGRAIGVVFGLGFGFFVWTGALRGRLAWAVLGVGLLGGLQAAIGWIMVASGLQPGMTAVAPLKLMAHLLTASLILAALLWIATGLSDTPRARVDIRLRAGSMGLLGLVLLQIALGALVAGAKAGLIYNTWPLMDGRLVPPLTGLFVVQPWIENFVDNVTLVQFNHRLMAYALVALALWHALSAHRLARGSAVARRAAALAGLTLVQGLIGIATLIFMVPLGLGLLHQGFAMVVLAMAAVHARLSRQAAI